jgi:hypothetical protein
MNIVFQHPSGGCLWQGDCKDARDIRALDAAGIKAVFLAAKEDCDVKLPDRFDVLRGRLDDNLWPDRNEVRYNFRCADMASDILSSYLVQGDSVLSSCKQGRNRSGLASSFLLIKQGVPAEQAIAMIRKARRFALANPAFTRMIRGFGRARLQGAVAQHLR